MDSKAYQPQVYQVDFTKKSAGKQFANTKCRISWKFGFVNEEAIASGATGVECRGKEHEVCLIWSITSGKRLVTFDGKEVHYSISPREKKFQFMWIMKGGRVMRIMAHAVSPIGGSPIGWRQYDLSINGLSFFDFTKVFELGPGKRGYITPAISAIASRKEAEEEISVKNYAMEEYSLEQRKGEDGKDVHLESNLSRFNTDLALRSEHRKDSINTDVVQHSYNEEYTQRTAPFKIDLSENVDNQTPEGDLLDFTFAPSPTSVAASTILTDDLLPYEAKSFSTNSNPAQADIFASDYINNAPTKTYTHVSNDIMNAYGSNQETIKQLPITIEYSSVNDNRQSTTDHKNIVGDFDGHVDSQREQKLYGIIGAPSLEESSTSSPCTSEQQEPWENNVNGFEHALKKLVNFDDISSAPDSDIFSKLTMRSIESKVKQNNNRSSNPLPPVAHTWCGPQPSLSEMKANKHTSTIKSEPVMRSQPSHAAHPGAIVLYGTQVGNQGSLPPPATGFGIGASMGYSQSHNRSYARCY